MPTELNHYSAIETAAAIAQGKHSAVAFAEACLARIEARDREVQAWEHIDRAYVLEQARARDRERPRGPLHGVPVGVKDIIDTFDMPSGYGSPIYAGHRPRADAACVALLREAGAVIMGKTVTVELAAFHYARTRNPHNLAHTPAGSSSGSGAAVADFMVPVALGTQTGGSTIRPAAFCGTVGYKPTFNLINRAGVKPLAESQDTVGLLGRTVADMGLMLSVLTGCAAPAAEGVRAPRIAVCRMNAWPALNPDMAKAMETAAAGLARAGANVDDVTLPPPFADSLVAQRQVNDYESWRALSYERIHHFEKLSTTVQARLQEAASCTYAQYRQAQDVISKCRALLDEMFGRYDVLVTPSSIGEAPEGYTNTGDSNYIRIWTSFHTPTLNLPLFRGDKGLPMGLQVIGPVREDRRTLGFAEWIYRALT
ncbi:MAG TPA: amidase [Burkholderiales bacterium]|nr:amidase [Burkholderiales bacterium]